MNLVIEKLGGSLLHSAWLIHDEYNDDPMTYDEFMQGFDNCQFFGFVSVAGGYPEISMIYRYEPAHIDILHCDYDPTCDADGFKMLLDAVVAKLKPAMGRERRTTIYALADILIQNAWHNALTKYGFESEIAKNDLEKVDDSFGQQCDLLIYVERFCRSICWRYSDGRI